MIMRMTMIKPIDLVFKLDTTVDTPLSKDKGILHSTSELALPGLHQVA